MRLSSAMYRGFVGSLVLAGLTLSLACDSNDKPAPTPAPVAKAPVSAVPAPKPAPAVAASAAPAQNPVTVRPTLRIKAGSEKAFTDSKGVKWDADTGFAGGQVEERSGLPITGTATPELYQSERWGMNSYSFKVPNGAYVVKLHFSEDYEGINGPTDRLFTYSVHDGGTSGKTVKEVKDFSPWKASGAQFKAYVDSVPVNVTAGEITIVFESQAENPQINAIEIVPQ